MIIIYASLGEIMDNIIAQAQLPILIKTGNLSVLASGSFITANNQNAEIKLGSLCFEFIFTSNDIKPTMQVEEANQGQKLIFKLDGFNSSPLRSS